MNTLGWWMSWLLVFPIASVGFLIGALWGGRKSTDYVFDADDMQNAWERGFEIGKAAAEREHVDAVVNLFHQQ